MKRNGCLCIGLIAVTLFVYWGVWNHAFVRYDDQGYVFENQRVLRGMTLENIAWAITATEQTNWHPLTWWSHMLDSQMFGVDWPGGHHLTNLLLHIANTLLMFAVIQRLTGAVWRSMFVATIFAVHPVHVESVAWVSERKDVLSMMFWLLSILSYVAYVRSGSRRCYLLTLGLMLIGLLAKPMLVTAPFLLLLLDYWPLDRFHGSRGNSETCSARNSEGVVPRLFRLTIEKIPMFVMVAAVSVVTWVAQKEGGAVGYFPPGHRVATVTTGYVRYIGKTLWPTSLSPLYPNHVGMWQAWQIAMAAVTLVLITVIVLRYARQRPYLIVGWFLYLGTLAPVIGLVGFGRHSIADRYLYMPMTGLLVMLAWAANDLLKTRPASKNLIGLTVASAIVACLCLTPQQVKKWKDSESLFQHAVNVTDRNDVMHHFLADAFKANGRWDDAIAHYRRSLDIHSENAKAHNNLGTVLATRGNTKTAIQHYRQALRIDPELAIAHNNLASALASEGNLNGAIDMFRQALRIDPNQIEVHKNLGVALRSRGDSTAAIRSFLEAIRLNPQDADTHNRLGNTYASQRRWDKAVGHYQTAARLQPNLPEVYFNLGLMLHQGGSLDQAMRNYQQALKLRPEFPEVHNNLGMLMQQRGQLPVAISHFRRALEMDPNNENARKNLVAAQPAVDSSSKE